MLCLLLLKAIDLHDLILAEETLSFSKLVCVSSDVNRTCVVMHANENVTVVIHTLVSLTRVQSQLWFEMSGKGIWVNLSCFLLILSLVKMHWYIGRIYPTWDLKGFVIPRWEWMIKTVLCNVLSLVMFFTGYGFSRSIFYSVFLIN